MQTRNENGTLTIILEGRIDTNNAPQVEAELLSAAEGQEKIALDAEQLEYISSAGLRVLMKLCKIRGEAVRVTNVSRDVYEIFETTGFTEILDVKKALRQVSVEGCEVVGSGGYGTVYRLDRETIIKVYMNNSPELIENERLMSQRAFVAGLPTAIPYDTVRVGDKYGVVYEMLDAKTAAEHITADPDHLEDYVRRFAAALREFHSIEITDSLFHDKKQLQRGVIDTLKDFLTPEESAEINNYLDSVPERHTFLHGDYNFKNVMFRGDEVMLIDIGDAGFGHPAFDLAGVYLATIYMKGTRMSTEEKIRLMGYDPELADRVWAAFCGEYFGADTPEKLEHCTQMLTPLALVATTYHAMRRVAGLSREQIELRVNSIVRGKLLPAIRNCPALDL